MVIGALVAPLLLTAFSFFQKTLIGANPWVLKGYLVPLFFGLVTGVFIGILYRRMQRLHRDKLRAHEEASRELMASEERFRLLAENARDVIFFYNLIERQYEYLSPSVFQLTGHQPEEFYVNPALFPGLVHEDDREILSSTADRIADGTLPPVLEFRLRHRDGHTVWVNQRHNLRTDREGRPLALEGLCTDVSSFRKAQLERLNLEQQLQQSQKMEAIGRLAGGIAHDFNNLLTVINGYVELLLISPPWDKEPCFELQEIKQAGRKAADLTSQLLTFSRKQVAKPRVLDLESAVQDSLRMIARMVGENIQVKTDIGPGVGQVYTDPTQLDQILVNLILNARDALEGNGTIYVSLEKLDLTGQFCQKCRDPLNGQYLVLAVSDDGHGIDPDIMSSIFDPFFTTKDVGQGTGLGLSTVFGIVHQLEGHIQVSSKPGEGALFRILLPQAEDMVNHDQQSENLPGRQPTPHGESILVVEDEALVRSLAATILQQSGYQIHLAENGRQALKRWRELDGKIDLVLTDVVMPEMGGISLAMELRKNNPDLPVLFMSGYMDEHLVAHDFDKNAMELLNKPFGAEELNNRVSQALGGDRRPAG